MGKLFFWKNFSIEKQKEVPLDDQKLTHSQKSRKEINIIGQKYNYKPKTLAAV